jgi:archaellum biogenesis ATPase FlaH
MKKYIMNDNFNNKTMFFLDAHVDNNNIHNYKKKCPLFDELEAIKSIERKDNIIMIDDLRIIKNAFPWGETSYGNIDFLQQIKQTILTINKDYKFATLNGYVNDDVLIAYV